MVLTPTYGPGECLRICQRRRLGAQGVLVDSDRSRDGVAPGRMGAERVDTFVLRPGDSRDTKLTLVQTAVAASEEGIGGVPAIFDGVADHIHGLGRSGIDEEFTNCPGFGDSLPGSSTVAAAEDPGVVIGRKYNLRVHWMNGEGGDSRPIWETNVRPGFTAVEALSHPDGSLRRNMIQTGVHDGRVRRRPSQDLHMCSVGAEGRPDGPCPAGGPECQKQWEEPQGSPGPSTGQGSVEPKQSI